MAITKIDDIFLYNTDNPDSVSAKTYLTNNKIVFNDHYFGDKNQWPQVFAPLKTWWPDGSFNNVNAFPFIIYTEIHDDLSPANYPKKFFAGLAAIQSSNLVELYGLGRTAT